MLAATNGEGSMALYRCRPIGCEFLTEAPLRATTTLRTSVDAGVLFEVLADAPATPKWALPITQARWLSPAPFGVGSRRTLTFARKLTGDERYIAWEPGRRLAYSLEATNVPGIAALAEEYRIDPCVEGGCELQWTLAIEVRGRLEILSKATRPFVRAALRRMSRDLVRYAATQ